MGHAVVSKNCDYQKESVSLHIHLFNILLNKMPTCVEPTGYRRRQNPVTIKGVIKRAGEFKPPLIVLMIVCLLFSNDKLYVKLQTSRQQPAPLITLPSSLEDTWRLSILYYRLHIAPRGNRCLSSLRHRCRSGLTLIYSLSTHSLL